MNEIYEISQTTRTLTTCPVLIPNYGFEERGDYAECGTVLQVMTTCTVVGDDYGSWPEIGVYFDCGHTLSQMEKSLKHAEYV